MRVVGGKEEQDKKRQAEIKSLLKSFSALADEGNISQIAIAVDLKDGRRVDGIVMYKLGYARLIGLLEVLKIKIMARVHT